MGAVSVLMTGERLWSADGVTATVTGVDDRGLLARIDGETTPVPIPLDKWRLALICDFCDRPADLAIKTCEIDAALVCTRCGHAAGRCPAAWVHPMSRTLLRELYTRCGRLI